MNSNNNSKKREYLLNIYYTEYLIEIAKITSALNEIKRFLIVEGLDIDIDSYINEFNTIKKEVSKLEKSGTITTNIYQSYKNRIKELLDKINDEYNSLTIVGLYLKKINDLLSDKDSSIEEIKEIIEKLNDYVSWIHIIDEKEYQNVCEKYGVIKNKVLIDLLVMSEEHKKK